MEVADTVICPHHEAYTSVLTDARSWPWIA